MSDDEKLDHIVLEDDGAEAVWVSMNHDGTLQIGDLNFSEAEAKKLRDFISRHY